VSYLFNKIAEHEVDEADPSEDYVRKEDFE
jgi:hypothetical protein